MGDTSFVVLITTHNNVEDIDKTWESIQMQDYPKENIWIYIVDFESTDGTYEKILGYNRYRTAVFQIPDVYDERARESRAITLVKSQPPLSIFQHLCSLKPGDILYSSCFSICEEVLDRYRVHGASLMICEADIMAPNGTIMCQGKIAEQEMLLDPLKNDSLLFEEFYGHYVGYFGGEISPVYHSYVGNERRFWSKVAYGISIGTKFVYSPQTLLCLKERTYCDEVAELLSRWEQVIKQQRMIQVRAGGGMKIDVAKVNRNLANYSLWRISKRYSELAVKEREDMLYLAEIIDPTIKKSEIYKEFWEKVTKGSEICYADYEAYFERENGNSQKRIQAAIESGEIEWQDTD